MKKNVFFLALVLLSAFCAFSLPAQTSVDSIEVTKSELGRVKRHLIFSMKNEQKNSAQAYTLNDISKVDEILCDYYEKIEKCKKKNKKNYMKFVKSATQSLNSLNKDCSDCLINEEQRLLIIEFISKTAYMFGFINDQNQDLTIEWRNW